MRPDIGLQICRTKKMKKPVKKKIEQMSDAEMKQELTDMITKDVMYFCEIVINKRVSLFVEEIYKGIKK